MLCLSCINQRFLYFRSINAGKGSCQMDPAAQMHAPIAFLVGMGMTA